MGIDAHDWIHVYQFRKGYFMRHCFTRRSNYRHVVSGVANTWNVNQDDVLEIIELRSQPTGVPRSAHAVIVKIWGDDFVYDTRQHVLVDIELSQPLSFLENPILDRKVVKFPVKDQQTGHFTVDTDGRYLQQQDGSLFGCSQSQFVTFAI